MKFTLQFDIDNAAFEDNEGNETARILEKYAERIRDDWSHKLESYAKGCVKDANGNTIGEWKVTYT